MLGTTKQSSSDTLAWLGLAWRGTPRFVPLFVPRILHVRIRYIGTVRPTLYSPAMKETFDSVDVLIIGAGLSGIGAACQLRRMCPDSSLMVFESREGEGVCRQR